MFFFEFEIREIGSDDRKDCLKKKKGKLFDRIVYFVHKISHKKNIITRFVTLNNRSV